MTIIDKKWTPWLADDDAWLVGARIIGRARLQLAGGGIVHGLLVEHDEQVGNVRAVYLNRERGCFETVEVMP
jgi:hypothetical protein